ncbi:uncharacterized protein DSM5745_03692 [Aspergillus mulundensis]|uniref:Aminoglycoside phosphotransferase domain-containing protein n=1 Tax=Aspergillus mulundensis TaxID=1810919 RepID=A0A3D8SL64_9EURO|nr:Uncharacterized protein DSM5745_03692 [Aspergillus mulundensis]RDW87050.1 Uncharacterized protein DSM5745_03692 [Aspergillus mulundensis]
MSSPSDKIWLEKCKPEALPIPPFDRCVYILKNHVVKKALQPGERGFDGYVPDTATVAQRDVNEIRALELVQEYTTIPVPKLVHEGDRQRHRFNVFERILGITIFEGSVWDNVPPRQQEGIKLQVQEYIKQLAKIPNAPGSVRSLSDSGEIIHNQLPHRGPFDSTQDFLSAYKDNDVPFVHEINATCLPVFSHMDWDLSNIVLHPNLDAVAGVIDWERAAFFPEGGRAIHRMCHQWRGWEALFDGIEFPVQSCVAR